MLRNLRTLVGAALLVILPSIASAEVLFADRFDEKPDWAVPYTSLNQLCNTETGCTNKPEGYYGFYISRSVISPATGNGLHLDGTNKRGSSGKGLTFWDQTDGTIAWTSGMQLGIDFPARKEVFVRYWIKMQPGYKYYKGSGSAMMRKLNHISHYVYNGKPFTFFTDGGHHPTTVNQFQFANNNTSNLQNTFFVRPDTNYNGGQSNAIPPALGVRSSAGVYNYLDLPDDTLARGNYTGTGTEYNSAGMIADGNWHSVEFYLKSNTVPGVADGEYKFWLDGVLQISDTGLLYRDASSTLPEEIWNFVHIGGNTINPFLGTGVSGEQWYAVDDLVISTSYSGPPAKPVNVQASGASDSAIRVNWTPGDNNANYPVDGYRIYYGTSPDALSEVVTVGNVTQAEIPNLAAGKTYYICVAGYNKSPQEVNDNESLRSLTVYAATAASTSTPVDATAPAVSIQNPTAGSVLSGVATLGVQATDNVGVSKVELYLNGSLFAVLGSAPYTLAWNSANTANGSYTLSAKAYDAAGNVGQSAQVAITVFNDLAAPVVSINAPVAGSAVAGTLAVTATATDNVGVTMVEFYVNGARQATSTAAPYGFTWNTSLVANGDYTVSAKAYDAAGNAGNAPPVSVVVMNDFVEPAVAITSPTGNVGGTITVEASASDNVKVEKVEFYLDGVLKWTFTQAPYGFALNTSTLANGTHAIVARAYDAAGNSAQASGTINVFNDNFAPSIASFAMPQVQNSTTVAVISLSASDDVGVAGYLITESDVVPSPSDTRWSTTVPGSFTFSGTGSRTAYAWAKDAAGRISAASTANVNIDTVLPMITAMTFASGPISVTVNVSASDNVAVEKIQIYLDKVLQMETAGSSLSYSWSPSTRGSQQVTVKVYDVAGNVRSRSMNMTKF